MAHENESDAPRELPSQEPAPGGTVAPPPQSHWLRNGLFLLLFVGVSVAGIVYEMRSSRMQARLFSRMAEGIHFEVQPGPSDDIVFPVGGPLDVRRGHTRIPMIAARLDSLGFDLTHQARWSEDLSRTVRWGAYPVYGVKTSAGLTVLDRHGRPIVHERFPEEAYLHFDSIPDLLWRTLLYVESREFLDETAPQQNPAVEWDRFLRSVAELGLKTIGLEGNVPGGSTLATQIEKFRHSPGGLTRTPADKLRQMFSASLRAYRTGPNTVEERREIVRNYINSVPLAARPGHGEVIGTADGMWAWYGIRLDSVNAVLNTGPTDPGGRRVKAEVYRRVLSLLLAHRRPSYYLSRAEGRADLADLTDAYLGLLVAQRVIPRWLADEARRVRDGVRILDEAPGAPPMSFTERKASTLVRTQLLTLTGTPSLYDLERLDLTARSALDLSWYEEATDLLRSLGRPDFVAANGLREPRLLGDRDPSRVIYAVTLLERMSDRSALRIETDNFDGPLNLGGSSRLELGSTAKLRTLVTYLEVIDELWEALAPLERDSLRARPVAPRDQLTRWTTDYLLANPGASKAQTLRASMERRYSGSPGERFATGGGVQSFANFDNQFDGQVLTVLESFRNSVNLPFVRMMRDLVNYEVYRTGSARVIEEGDSVLRQQYLERFADDEGSRFMRQFWRKYEGKSGPDIFDALVSERRLGHRRLAWAFRAVAPDAGLEQFSAFLREHAADERLSDAVLADVYERSDPTPHSLSDLGFLARIHPLDLWMATYLVHNPGVTLQQVLDASREVRVEVYGWLYRTSRRNAQDQRIRTMLEMEAFQGILRRWRRVGYPFPNIVPSLGTSIGSSGDRPRALAELAGIIVNGGMRLPVVGVRDMVIAEGTPFETRFEAAPAPAERVLSEEVAAELQRAMLDVVENGTARRARGSFVAEDGTVLPVGGKTGTGDNRFRVFSRSGQTESRVVNRTATFVFFAGDRYYGVVVAYVPGQEAGQYRFTSGLPSQVLRLLGPRLEGVAAPEPTPVAAGG